MPEHSLHESHCLLILHCWTHSTTVCAKKQHTVGNCADCRRKNCEDAELWRSQIPLKILLNSCTCTPSQRIFLGGGRGGALNWLSKSTGLCSSPRQLSCPSLFRCQHQLRRLWGPFNLFKQRWVRVHYSVPELVDGDKQRNHWSVSVIPEDYDPQLPAAL